MAKLENKLKNDKEEKGNNKSDELASSNTSEEKLNFNMIHESNDIADEKGYDHDLHFNMFDDNFSNKEREKGVLTTGYRRGPTNLLPHVYSDSAMNFAQSRATL